MIVHQNHAYRHLPGGRPHYTLEESERNQALAGGVQHMFTLLDTDYALQRKGENFEITRPPLTTLRLLRQLELWFAPVDRRRQGWRWALARRLRRLRRRMTGEAL
jgi:CBS-domain-containing membrane protein